MLLWWFACADPISLRADVASEEVRVTASRPIDRVVASVDGRRVSTAELVAPLAEVGLLRAPDDAGVWEIQAFAGEEAASVRVEVPARPALQVWVDAPVGAGPTAVADGDAVPVSCVPGTTVEAWLTAEDERGLPRFRVGERAAAASAIGTRAGLGVTVDCEATTPVMVEAGASRVGFALTPAPTDRASLEAALGLVSVAFPALPDGAADHSLAADRVSLPPAAVPAALARLGLRVRPRADLAPWGYLGATLRNPTAAPAIALVRARVEQAGTVPAAFRPRLRGAEAGNPDVVARIRVPAGASVTVPLPVHVDDEAVAEGRYERVVEVLAPGLDAPLHVDRRPLWVTRTPGWVAAGFGLSVLGSVFGGAVMLVHGRRFLAASRTVELATVGSFCAATFVVATASQVAAMGVGALLGPFTPLVFGLFDDTFRTVLLAGLVALVPRPGVVALATAVGWTLRGLVLGSLHPLDLLYLGSATFWLEGCLWLAGVSTGHWLTVGPRSQWFRLGFGFGVGQLLTAALGLATSAVLYRLYWSPAYAAAMIGLPGFLYVLLAVEPARRFALALRTSVR